MASVTTDVTSAKPIRAKLGRDDWTLRILIGLVGLYLLATLALPLYAILTKSATVYDFRFAKIGIEDAGDTSQDLGTAQDWVDQLASPVNDGRSPTARTRLPARDIFPRDHFAEGMVVRFEDRSAAGGLLLYEGVLSEAGSSFEVEAENLRKLLIQACRHRRSSELRRIFHHPRPSPLDRQQPLHRHDHHGHHRHAGLPVRLRADPKLHAGEGALQDHRDGADSSALAAPGHRARLSLRQAGHLEGPAVRRDDLWPDRHHVTASVFYTFPHALVIILVALSIADARLYEAATALRASRRKTFFTVTLPGARYGLISAAFVVFNLVITDFGVPKVIGGQYNVLALDIYKQVVGQQNFEMGAVVSVVLLIPAVIAFTVDRLVQRRQVALLSARAVPYEPKPSRRFDLSMLTDLCPDLDLHPRPARHVPVCSPCQILALRPLAQSQKLQLSTWSTAAAGIQLPELDPHGADGRRDRHRHHLHRCLSR